MNENDLRIAKISQLLNTAIRSKNSDDYNKALSLIENSEAKPTLKQILDAQVADKKRKETEAKVKEELEDRIRLEKARMALESEERKHTQKKSLMKQQLQQSWNEDITLKELQKELENLKYQGLEEPNEENKEACNINILEHILGKSAQYNTSKKDSSDKR